MKLQFLGAAATVTGSRYLVTHGKTRVLVDCGLFQGFKHLRLKNRDPFPIQPETLDAVILTHAHLDHSGYIPLLVKNGFKGPIYATPATQSLCQILLPDSGYLQEEEAKFANLRGYSKHSPALPLYTHDEAKACLESFVSSTWRTPTRISKNSHDWIEFEFHPAGHLLGAASVLIRSDRESIVFSGDLGRTTDPLIRDPECRQGGDALVVESTYGDRTHPPSDPEQELKDVILRTISRQGILLIPSFAIGRAQLVMHYIHELKKKRAIPAELPIYLNSPMASDANGAYVAHLDELKISASDWSEIWKSVRIISSAEESKELNTRTEPSIIIAASGMASGGRVLHHLKSLVPEPRNTVLFVGFQAGGTRGELMIRGIEKIKIHGQYWPVRAEVVSMESLSAHADADEVLAWIQGLTPKPKRIFVTHGEPAAADALRYRIEDELRIRALVPEHFQEFVLGVESAAR